jgi:hypothetical protein
MASIIRIKRSNSALAPTTLGNGELAYSAGSGTQANGGERLYIGFGTEVGGGAPQFVIGGKYFTDLLDHVHGTLTASSALLVDSNKKVDNFKVDNLDFDGNTISSTDTDGNLLLDPNGSGYVQIMGTNGIVIPSGTSAQRGPSLTGTVRYNIDTSQYEGYNGTNWTSLGGVRSVDGLTYIIAETSPGNSDDTLHFYTGTGLSTNVEAAQLDANSLKLLQTTASTNTTTGALIVAGGAGIAGNLNVGGNSSVSGNSSITGTLGVTGATTLSSTLNVTGNTTLNGTLAIVGGISTANIIGDFSVNTNKFTVQASTGNTTVAGDLTVNGVLNSDDITSANISVTGNATITGNLTVQGTTTTVNSTAVAISDINLTLAKDAANATEANGAGLTVAGAGATILYASATDDWSFNKNVNIPNLTVTGQITGNASSATKWNTARDLSLTGDATATLVGVDGTANVSAAITFATVNANVGTFGDSVTVPTFTVNAKGLVTSASQTAIPTATTAVNGLASFDSTNFTVTSGLVSISVIDGGSY